MGPHDVQTVPVCVPVMDDGRQVQLLREGELGVKKSREKARASGVLTQ